MALQPVLTLVTEAEDASVITVVDGTGAYNASTNPGGYGSPNPAVADITTIILRLIYFSDLTIAYTFKPSDYSLLFAGGIELTPSDFGLAAFNDGVYDFKYYVGFDGATQMSFTEGTNNFTLANADTVFAAAVGFVLPDYNESKIFFIDRTKTLDSSGGSVTEALPDIGVPTDIIVVYEGTLRMPTTKIGENCLKEDIAAWADSGCSDAADRNLDKRKSYLDAIAYKFEKGLYTDAHNLAVKLQNYCSSCGC